MTQESEHTEIKFFKPRIIEDCYKKGINGKKILVVGDSFYCLKTACEYHSKCTDTKQKDSSTYNLICPERLIHTDEGENVIPLRDEPTVAIDEYDSYSYQKFKGLLQSLMGEDSEKFNVWDYVAFTNYIQFFLPQRESDSRFITEKDYSSFVEVVNELKPDIVVTWGDAEANSIRNMYGRNKIEDELIENQYYYNRMHLEGHSFTILNLYHPSSKKWASDIYNSYIYFKKVLSIN